MLSIPTTDQPWIRILGVVVPAQASYYIVGARHETRSHGGREAEPPATRMGPHRRAILRATQGLGTSGFHAGRPSS